MKNRLLPVVNMHNYDELCKDPDGNRVRFVAISRQLAEHYRAFRRS